MNEADKKLIVDFFNQKIDKFYIKFFENKNNIDKIIFKMLKKTFISLTAALYIINLLCYSLGKYIQKTDISYETKQKAQFYYAIVTELYSDIEKSLRIILKIEDI